MKRTFAVIAVALAVFFPAVSHGGRLHAQPTEEFSVNAQLARYRVREAPGGALEGVGLASLATMSRSQARVVAYARAMLDISRRLQSFGLNALDEETIVDILDYVAYSPGEPMGFQVAYFDGVVAGSSIVSSGDSGGNYRVVARFAWGDQGPVVPPAGTPAVGYVPAFVTNARRNAPGNVVVGAGVARMATRDKSRTVAQIRAMMDVSHQLEGIVRDLMTDYSATSEADGMLLAFHEVVTRTNVSLAVFEAVLHGAYVIDSRMGANGDYWVVVGFAGNNPRPVVPARPAVAPGSDPVAESIRHVITNTPEDAIWGAGVASAGEEMLQTTSMLRMVARTRAMAHASRQLNMIINRMITDYVSASEYGYGLLSFEEEITQSISESMLRGAFVVEEGFADGYYWVIVMLPAWAAILSMDLD